MKTCKGCGRELPLVLFGKNGKKGLKARCKECTNAERRGRYWADPEKARAASLTYYREHRDEEVARMKQYRERTHDERMAYYRAYRADRREELAERTRARRARMTPEERAHAAEQSRQWIINNRQRMRELVNRRRVRIAQAPLVEDIDRTIVIERDNRTCYLCGRALADGEIELDHVIPLSRGGEHSYANLRVACKPCNARKKDKTPDEYFAVFTNI